MFLLLLFLYGFYFIIFLLLDSGVIALFFFFFSSRRRHTRCLSDWSSDVCSSDLAECEISRHHDRVQALEAGERDLRGRADAEDIGEHGKQRDLGDRVAEEEDRLEQVADRDRARHRGRERDAEGGGDGESERRTAECNAGVIGKGATAHVLYECGPDPPDARKQAGFDQAARNRDLPQQKHQRDRVPLAEPAYCPHHHRTICSMVPIICPRSTWRRIAI